MTSSEPLARLGARDLFSSKADLSGMSGPAASSYPRWSTSLAVDVSREGAGAAAATGAIAQFAMLMPEEVRCRPPLHLLHPAQALLRTSCF